MAQGKGLHTPKPRRRLLAAAVAWPALAWTGALRAQAKAPVLIGWLSSGTQAAGEQGRATFVEGMAALDMQHEMVALSQGWSRRGYQLQMGVGIAQGFATIGGIGFEGRIDYGAIGNVTNLSARLCGEAKGGEILVSTRVVAALEGEFEIEAPTDFVLKGLQKPVPASRVLGRKASGSNSTRQQPRATPRQSGKYCHTSVPAVDSGPA